MSLPVLYAGRDLATIDAVLNIKTGEMVPINADIDELADVIDGLKELEAAVKVAKRAANKGILARFDKRGKWSGVYRGLKVSAPSPEPKYEWNVDALRGTLLDLLDQELIDDEAFDAALDQVVVWKAKTNGLKALMKLGGEITERIESCRIVTEPERYVSVKPA